MSHKIINSKSKARRLRQHKATLAWRPTLEGLVGPIGPAPRYAEFEPHPLAALGALLVGSGRRK